MGKRPKPNSFLCKIECSDIFLFRQLCADTFQFCACKQQGTSGCRGLGWEVQGYWFKPQGRQNIDSVVVVVGVAWTPLLHHWDTLELVTNPQILTLGPLMTFNCL